MLVGLTSFENLHSNSDGESNNTNITTDYKHLYKK